jgi:preprotein translocase subunit SecG
MGKMFAIMFGVFIGICVLLAYGNHQQQKRCEAQGGTFVMNNHGSNLCYPPGTLLRIN